MTQTVNLFQISHDTNNYESSVYQTPELNPSLQQTQTLENNHDSNQDRVPPKQLEYQETNGQDENVLNSSETEESQHNEYFDFEQQSRMCKEPQARQ